MADGNQGLCRFLIELLSVDCGRFPRGRAFRRRQGKVVWGPMLVEKVQDLLARQMLRIPDVEILEVRAVGLGQEVDPLLERVRGPCGKVVVPPAE